MQVFNSLSHLPLVNNTKVVTGKGGENSYQQSTTPMQAQPSPKKQPLIGAEVALHYFVPTSQNNRVREGVQRLIQHHNTQLP